MASSSSSAPQGNERVKRFTQFLRVYDYVFCSFNIVEDAGLQNRNMELIKETVEAYLKTAGDDEVCDPKLKIEEADLYVTRFLELNGEVVKKRRSEMQRDIEPSVGDEELGLLTGENPLGINVNISGGSSESGLGGSYVEPQIPSSPAVPDYNLVGNSNPAPQQHDVGISDDTLSGDLILVQHDVRTLDECMKEVCSEFLECYGMDLNKIIDTMDPMFHVLLPFFNGVRNMVRYMTDVYAHFFYVFKVMKMKVKRTNGWFPQVFRQLRFTIEFAKTALHMLNLAQEEFKKNAVAPFPYYKQAVHDALITKTLEEAKSILLFYCHHLFNPVDLLAMFSEHALTVSQKTHANECEFASLETLGRLVHANTTNMANELFIIEIAKKHKAYEASYMGLVLWGMSH